MVPLKLTQAVEECRVVSVMEHLADRKDILAHFGFGYGHDSTPTADDYIPGLHAIHYIYLHFGVEGLVD